MICLIAVLFTYYFISTNRDRWYKTILSSLRDVPIIFFIYKSLQYHILITMLLIMASLIWRTYIFYILSELGLIEKYLGMEHVGCLERVIIKRNEELGQRRSVISCLLQIETPRNLKVFKDEMWTHFFRFTRFRSRIISVGHEYFFKKVTEKDVLEK